ncbi:hypothetical protein CFC21_025290 [Triticum aestivum]|uniref:Uncharacterized protein n=2 Tax=Triticum aestivum TaxID=4565 RepID=A0A9R1EIB5_WHEAT|nr:hypothetical protein CFC21_025290 [Triticum aestivum]
MPDPLPHAPAAGMVDAVHDDTKLQRALVGGGIAKSSVALFLAFFRAPAGVFLLDSLLVAAYYGVLVAIILFGLAGAWTGLWVSHDPLRRRAVGMTVLWASVLSLLLLAGVGGHAILK